MDGLFQSEAEKFRNNDKGISHARKRYKMGHYPYITRSMEAVMSMVIHVRKCFGHEGPVPKFLDCGCGVGNVVMMAHFAGFDAYGIEYDPVTLQRGKRLFKQFRVDPKKLFRGDILEYPNYADYDVIYGYCPMCDNKKEQAFENKVSLDMKIGAVLCGLGFRSHRSPPGIEKMIGPRAYFQQLMLEASDDHYASCSPVIKVAHEKD